MKSDLWHLRLQHLFTAIVLPLLTCGGVLAQDNNTPPDGFEAVFTGRDLKGWDGGEVKAPKFFEEMTYQNWYDYRNQMRGGVSTHWRVEQGELVGTGNGPDLVTWQHYADFEMWVDWKIASDSDAGIGLRYGSQIKLMDPGSKKATAKGSGGLWTNETHENTPTKRADKPVGQWNRMYIRIVGPYVNVVLNGQNVVDNIVFENVFDRQRPIDRSGPIHLQSHQGEVGYRNVFIRELSDKQANTILNEIAGDDDQYTPLFNGKDLKGWAGALDGYEVVDGSLRGKRLGGGNINTNKRYENFILRFELKLSPGGNNGVLIRTPNKDASPTVDILELQILDDHHIMHKNLAAYQYHGSAYGIKPAIRGYLRPTGQWNQQEIYVHDDHVKVKLNGYPILDVRLKNAVPKHPAAVTQSGHIGLSGYSDPISFKNIRILEIK